MQFKKYCPWHYSETFSRLFMGGKRLARYKKISAQVEFSSNMQRYPSNTKCKVLSDTKQSRKEFFKTRLNKRKDASPYLPTTNGLSSIQGQTVFFNRPFDKGRLKALISWCVQVYGETKTLDLVEKLKDLGYSYATKAGISLGVDDLKIPSSKKDTIVKTERFLGLTNQAVEKGSLTSVEYFAKVIELWNKTSEKLKEEVINNFKNSDELNPVFIMAFSGARGSIAQVRQLTSMRGLMSDPQGRIINFPIQSNFREGLTLTEYVISCYGARKGVVDTALRTATSGYLTRRLVDVAQHVIIRGFNCGTDRGISLTNLKKGNKTLLALQKRIVGRRLAEDIYNGEQQLIATKNQEVSPDLGVLIAKNKTSVLVRSPLTCKDPNYVCQLCYGWSLANHKLVPSGEAVGIIAGQSIGEPGTQLTMRTFHTGGVFSGEISEELKAPFRGMAFFEESIPGELIRTVFGRIAFLTKQESLLRIIPYPEDVQTPPSPTDRNVCSFYNNRGLQIKDQEVYNEPSAVLPLIRADGDFQSKEQTQPLFLKYRDYAWKIKIPAFTILFVKQKQLVKKAQIIGEVTNIANLNAGKSIDSYQTLYSDLSGEIYFQRTKGVQMVVRHLLELIENSAVFNPLMKTQMALKARLRKMKTLFTPKASTAVGEFWVLSAQKQTILKPVNLFVKPGDFLEKNAILFCEDKVGKNKGHFTKPLENETSDLWKAKKVSSFITDLYDFGEFYRAKALKTNGFLNYYLRNEKASYKNGNLFLVQTNKNEKKENSLIIAKKFSLKRETEKSSVFERKRLDYDEKLPENASMSMQEKSFGFFPFFKTRTGGFGFQEKSRMVFESEKRIATSTLGEKAHITYHYFDPKKAKNAVNKQVDNSRNFTLFDQYVSRPMEGKPLNKPFSPVKTRLTLVPSRVGNSTAKLKYRVTLVPPRVGNSTAKLKSRLTLVPSRVGNITQENGLRPAADAAGVFKPVAFSSKDRKSPFFENVTHLLGLFFLLNGPQGPQGPKGPKGKSFKKFSQKLPTLHKKPKKTGKVRPNKKTFKTRLNRFGFSETKRAKRWSFPHFLKREICFFEKGGFSFITDITQSVKRDIKKTEILFWSPFTNENIGSSIRISSRGLFYNYKGENNKRNRAFVAVARNNLFHSIFGRKTTFHNFPLKKKPAQFLMDEKLLRQYQLLKKKGTAFKKKTVSSLGNSQTALFPGLRIFPDKKKESFLINKDFFFSGKTLLKSSSLKKKKPVLKKKGKTTKNLSLQSYTTTRERERCFWFGQDHKIVKKPSSFSTNYGLRIAYRMVSRLFLGVAGAGTLTQSVRTGISYFKKSNSYNYSLVVNTFLKRVPIPYGVPYGREAFFKPYCFTEKKNKGVLPYGKVAFVENLSTSIVLQKKLTSLKNTTNGFFLRSGNFLSRLTFIELGYNTVQKNCGFSQEEGLFYKKQKNRFRKESIKVNQQIPSFHMDEINYMSRNKNKTTTGRRLAYGAYGGVVLQLQEAVSGLFSRGYSFALDPLTFSAKQKSSFYQSLTAFTLPKQRENRIWENVRGNENTVRSDLVGSGNINPSYGDLRKVMEWLYQNRKNHYAFLSIFWQLSSASEFLFFIENSLFAEEGVVKTRLKNHRTRLLEKTPAALAAGRRPFLSFIIQKFPKLNFYETSILAFLQILPTLVVGKKLGMSKENGYTIAPRYFRQPLKKTGNRVKNSVVYTKRGKILFREQPGWACVIVNPLTQSVSAEIIKQASMTLPGHPVVNDITFGNYTTLTKFIPIRFVQKTEDPVKKAQLDLWLRTVKTFYLRRSLKGSKRLPWQEVYEDTKKQLISPVYFHKKLLKGVLPKNKLGKNRFILHPTVSSMKREKLIKKIYETNQSRTGTVLQKAKGSSLPFKGYDFNFISSLQVEYQVECLLSYKTRSCLANKTGGSKAVFIDRSQLESLDYAASVITPFSQEVFTEFFEPHAFFQKKAYEAGKTDKQPFSLQMEKIFSLSLTQSKIRKTSDTVFKNPSFSTGSIGKSILSRDKVFNLKSFLRFYFCSLNLFSGKIHSLGNGEGKQQKNGSVTSQMLRLEAYGEGKQNLKKLKPVLFDQAYNTISMNVSTEKKTRTAIIKSNKQVINNYCRFFHFQFCKTPLFSRTSSYKYSIFKSQSYLNDSWVFPRKDVDLKSKESQFPVLSQNDFHFNKTARFKPKLVICADKKGNKPLPFIPLYHKPMSFISLGKKPLPFIPFASSSLFESKPTFKAENKKVKRQTFSDVKLFSLNSLRPESNQILFFTQKAVQFPIQEAKNAKKNTLQLIEKSNRIKTQIKKVVHKEAKPFMLYPLTQSVTVGVPEAKSYAIRKQILLLSKQKKNSLGFSLDKKYFRDHKQKASPFLQLEIRPALEVKWSFFYSVIVNRLKHKKKMPYLSRSSQQRGLFFKSPLSKRMKANQKEKAIKYAPFFSLRPLKKPMETKKWVPFVWDLKKGLPRLWGDLEKNKKHLQRKLFIKPTLSKKQSFNPLFFTEKRKVITPTFFSSSTLRSFKGGYLKKPSVPTGTLGFTLLHLSDGKPFLQTPHVLTGAFSFSNISKICSQEGSLGKSLLKSYRSTRPIRDVASFCLPSLNPLKKPKVAYKKEKHSNNSKKAALSRPRTRGEMKERKKNLTVRLPSVQQKNKLSRYKLQSLAYSANELRFFQHKQALYLLHFLLVIDSKQVNNRVNPSTSFLSRYKSISKEHFQRTSKLGFEKSPSFSTNYGPIYFKYTGLAYGPYGPYGEGPYQRENQSISQKMGLSPLKGEVFVATNKTLASSLKQTDIQTKFAGLSPITQPFPEIRILTDTDLITFPYKPNIKTHKLVQKKKEKVTNIYLGEFLRYGKRVSDITAINQSGQVILLTPKKIVLRNAKPFLISSGGICNLVQGDFVNIQSPLITLKYKSLKTEDIVQGIPKIEQLFEARENSQDDSGIPNLLRKKFAHYKNLYPRKVAVRKAVEFIQHYVIDSIQFVYQGQGVNISDKHIEIIVKQMTSKVQISEPSTSGLLRGDIVNLEWIETINQSLEGKKAQYEPLVLGITKAALYIRGFISAASFQETIKILTQATLLQRRDYLRGLKENVILGHLIPSGTGKL